MVKKRFSIGSLPLITLIILIVYVLLLFILLMWAIFTAFKGNLDFLENPLWLPAKWNIKNFFVMLDNYVVQVNRNGTIRKIYIEGMLLNSVLYAVGSAFFSAFTTCITAYATARFNFKFNSVIYGIVIVTMTLPIVGNLPSELQLLRAFNMYDEIWGLWICKANFLGMYYLVFYGVFRAISKDITDAAYIDGASNLAVMFRISMPLAMNTFMTVMLIQFVGFWNDYTVTLTFMPTKPTLAFGLYEYSFSPKPAINNTPMRLMGCLVLIIPALVLFIVFHKRLMGNISVGGVKE